MNVFESQVGHDFVSYLMPRLVDAVEEIARNLPKPLVLPEISVKSSESVLKDLYEGYFCPGEETGVSQSERYRNLTATLRDLIKELKERLREADWILVERYCTAMSERDGEELSACFEAGFRAATQLIIAGLTSDKYLVSCAANDLEQTSNQMKRYHLIIQDDGADHTPGEDVWTMAFECTYDKAQDAEQAARRAVTAYLRTSEGREILNGTNGCFNWGDVMAHIPKNYFIGEKLHPLKADAIESWVSHDEDLTNIE